MGSNALVVIHKGRIIAEWGKIHQKLNVFSVRKSLLSALYGIYIANGQINPELTLHDIGIDDKGGLSSQEKKARIIDLLRARSGVYHPAAFETNGMRKRKPPRGAFKPDEHFYYNNWDFNALGTIFKRLTGLSVFESFNRSIALPLNMEDYSVADGSYWTSKFTHHPAYLFKLSARDMARFGMLYLQNGRWNGRQVISSAWIKESTQPYSEVPNNKGIGYGYLWWAPYSDNKHFRNRLGERSFSARGNGGQYILVAPELELVVVHTNNWKRTGNKIGTSGFGKLLKSILSARKPVLSQNQDTKGITRQ